MGMKEKKLSIVYKEFDSLQSLNKNWQALVSDTIKHNVSAYAPYSNFFVSAGVLLNNGKYYFGANVENASFPVGICAERNVLSHVITNFPHQKIEAIAIYGRNIKQTNNCFVSPCGMCRQAILETEQRQKKEIAIILVTSVDRITIFNSAKDILPLAFDKLVL